MEDFEVRTLLPIKQKNGKWIFPTEKIEKDNNDGQDYNNFYEDGNNIRSNTIQSQSLVEKYAREQIKLKSLKVNIAMLCSSVTADPVKNIRNLKLLIRLLQKSSTKMIVTEKKLVSLSILHVFNDVLPGYKIRNVQEENSKIKLKKDTKILLDQELSLLRYYKKYIDLLHNMIKNMKFKRHSGTLTAARKVALQEIGVIAAKCLCKLLVSRYYFNYYKIIISIVVPLIGHRNSVISDTCYSAIEKLYKVDKLGEASLEAVKQTVKVIKERNFYVSSDLLKTFLSLNLTEAMKEGKKKKDMKQVRKELNTMSRKEKRHKKKMRELEQQLRETEAHESKETKSKLQTEILKKIFWIYFHVLKDDQKMILITPVLEGLSKFAHLINLEFFGDLSSVLCCLMENENLGDNEKLHCMQTMFIILSGQAESLNIDPQRLYSHLYQILLNLNHLTSIDQFRTVLKCIDLMLIKRKKRISPNRSLAFVKRLCTVSLQVPIHFTISALFAIRTLMLDTKNSDILLDTEHMGSNIFLPELEDPEYCNASSSFLWELHFLTKHSNPLISDCARHILHGCPVQGKFRLPDWLLKLSPNQALDSFHMQTIESDFKKIKNPSKRLCVRNEIPQTISMYSEDNSLSEKCFKNINFANVINNFSVTMNE